jgi:hypothetical protein
MKQTILLATLAAALAACQDPGITVPENDGELMLARGQPVQMVAGGGSVVREDIAGAPREIYGFQAQVDAEGNAWGEAEVHFPSDDVKMHIAVQCLVIERNLAWMSGPVTRSDDPDTPVGRVFVWRVQDNGEGQGRPPDRVSRFVHRPSDNYPPDICRQKWALATFPWDNGTVRILTPGMPDLADLVGTWDATVLYFLNPGNPADTADLFDSDGRFRWTIAPNGRFSQIWWTPGEIFENVTGVMDVVNGHLVMWTDENPVPTPIDCADMRVSGSTISSRCSVPAGYDWDGDGEEDPSVVVSELRRKRTGILIDDLAGVWDAIVWRYTSPTDPTVTLDVLADGIHSVSVTVSLDSRLFFVIQPEHWTSQTVEVLIDGNQLLARDGSESESFVFTLERGTWSFSVPQEVDFDHDGTQDPAILEAVLVRR